MMNCATYTNSCTLDSATKAKTEEFHKRLQELYPGVEDVTKLPQGWSPNSKATPLGLTNDNLGCYFRGNGRRDEDEKFAAAIRTDNFISPACLLYYFEIQIISKGREGFMGLGLTSSQVILTRLPGCTRESYGYHADDGNAFNGDTRGQPFGPSFTSDDIIGCGYNLVEGKCFFTKNGLNLGKAFKDMPTNILLYPTVGLRTRGEEIRANFGQNKFEYDIEQDLRELRRKMSLTITDYPINDFSVWQSTLHRLIQSWLFQNSYYKTAEAFTKSTKLDHKENIQRVQQRNRIQQLVLEGKISEAIELTNCLCPNLLQNNPNLLFTLKCRQFVELISGAENDYQPILNYNNGHNNSTNGFQVEKKIVRLLQFGRDLTNYSQQLDNIYGKNETNEKMLQDTISLIAFTNPETSCFGKILDPKEREPISQLLNSSIVKAELGDSYRLPLEDVMNHLQKLVRLNDSKGKWNVDQLY